MTKSFINTKTFFFTLLSLCFFSANSVFAAGLEVQYPVIAGQTLTASSRLPDYVIYLFNAGIFLGFFAVFLSLIIAGVMYLLSPAKADLLAEAKGRVGGAISGLLILVLTYLIITTINPQLSFFNFGELPSVPPPPAEKRAPGVYFYNTPGCSNTRVQANTANVPDLGDSKNKINSVGFIGDPTTGAYYVSVLYDAVNFQGRCLFLDPNRNCQNVSPFAASASVYKYDFSPNGDGVYFYRKSFFNDKGGVFKVSNSSISPIYVQRLNDLKFVGVPEEEQDCAKYDTNGKCAKDGRRAPSLGGENISSVKINGDYFVLFVYLGPNDTPSGIWTSCQEFPTVEDANKIGPQQIKWSSVRNTSGVVPNYVLIVPIQKN